MLSVLARILEEHGLVSRTAAGNRAYSVYWSVLSMSLAIHNVANIAENRVVSLTLTQASDESI